MKTFSNNFSKVLEVLVQSPEESKCNELLPAKESAIFIRGPQLRLIVAREWLLGKKGPYCMRWTRSFLLPWAQDGGWACLDLFFHLFDFLRLVPKPSCPTTLCEPLIFSQIYFQICFAPQGLAHLTSKSALRNNALPFFEPLNIEKMFVCKSGPKILFNLFRQTLYPSCFQRLRIYQ